MPYDKAKEVSEYELLYGQLREVVVKNQIPYELYSAIQRLVPIHCVDVWIVDPNGNVLLGRRNIRPAKGLWWPPGGRRFRNERLGVAAARHCKKDTGLSIDPSRFVVLGHDILFFEDREQEPIDVGTDTPLTLMGILLSPEEAGVVQQIGELQEMRWISAKDILSGDYGYDEHVKKGVRGLIAQKLIKPDTQ